MLDRADVRGGKKQGGMWGQEKAQGSTGEAYKGMEIEGVDCSKLSRRGGGKQAGICCWPRGRKLADLGRSRVGVCHFG